MLSRKEYIEALRKALVAVNSQLRIAEEFDCLVYDNFMKTMLIVEKEKIYELVPELYKLLEHPCEHVREEVVCVLGFGSRLHVPEFKEKAFQIWLNDKSDIVKQAALRAWGSYFFATKNGAALKILYKILTDESIDISHRRTAMEKIFSITQESSSFYHPLLSKGLYKPKMTNQELSALIDWNEIEAIMKKYAPEVFN